MSPVSRVRGLKVEPFRSAHDQVLCGYCAARNVAVARIASDDTGRSPVNSYCCANCLTRLVTSAKETVEQLHAGCEQKGETTHGHG
jgi:hypothetical protein